MIKPVSYALGRLEIRNYLNRSLGGFQSTGSGIAPNEGTRISITEPLVIPDQDDPTLGPGIYTVGCLTCTSSGLNSIDLLDESGQKLTIRVSTEDELHIDWRAVEVVQ